MTITNLHRSALGVLVLSLVGGAMLRLSGLERRSISHPEMYIPGIRMADGTSEPAERTSLRRIVTGTFSADTHPPGYYLFMFPWTRIAGTSLTSMRLPSAVLGTASIPLVYTLAAPITGAPVAAAAAALLAFSGYHVFWSQVGRMFALVCFLGLSSTLLLLRVAHSSRRRPLLLGLYAALLLAGVASHVFFWTLLATHILWAFANARERMNLPDICRTQLLAVVLGSPLIAFAAYQSGNTVADLSSGVASYLWRYISFAFILPDGDSGFFSGAVPFTNTAGAFIGRGALFLCAVTLLILGVRRLWRGSPSETGFISYCSLPAPWVVSWLAAAGAGTMAIAFFVHMTHLLPPAFVNPTLASTRRLMILPAVLAFASILINRYWGRLPRPGKWNRFLVGDRALLTLLAIMPFTLLAAASQLRPLLNERGLLFTAPYLLLLLSAGLFGGRLSRSRTIVSVTVLALLLGASVFNYHNMRVDPADYSQFAAALTSTIGSGDLVFVHKIWYATPILYYLSPERYHIEPDYSAACARNPGARVWVVLLGDHDLTESMTRALAGYRLVRTLKSPPAGQALLYEPPRAIPSL